MVGSISTLAFAAAFSLGLAALSGVGLALLSWQRGETRRRVALVAAAGGLAGVAALGMLGGGERPERIAGGIARMVPVRGVVARTDHGLAVPLGRPEHPEGPSDIPEGFRGKVIVAERGDGTSNCHGWVFAGGSYWIPTECIDTILRDNGYRTVAIPQPGDLIVYRDDDDRPFHTGVVKAVGEDGFVLVESKWGQQDVFWHTPHDQAFGDDFEYWHADRDGHTLLLEGR